MGRLSNAERALHALIMRLEAPLVPAVTKDEAHYDWVPLPVGEFLRNMAVIETASQDRQERRFLDVGCGIGTKLVLAMLYRWQATGIERQEAYVQAARRLAPEATVHHIDAFAFTAYDQFDVVYLFHPMKEGDQERELEAHVVSRMRRGALVFLAGHDLLVEAEHVGLQVWRVL